MLKCDVSQVAGPLLFEWYFNDPVDEWKVQCFRKSDDTQLHGVQVEASSVLSVDVQPKGIRWIFEAAFHGFAPGGGSIVANEDVYYTVRRVLTGQPSQLVGTSDVFQFQTNAPAPNDFVVA